MGDGFTMHPARFNELERYSDHCQIYDPSVQPRAAWLAMVAAPAVSGGIPVSVVPALADGRAVGAMAMVVDARVAAPGTAQVAAPLWVGSGTLGERSLPAGD